MKILFQPKNQLLFGCMMMMKLVVLKKLLRLYLLNFILFKVSTRYQLLKESPYDHEVTRKMKRAASEIDKFSIRLGVFLKKYPIARIFVIFYMVRKEFFFLIKFYRLNNNSKIVINI